MEEAIKGLSAQFNFEPEIQNKEHFKEAKSFVLCGMGGSHLAAGLLKMYDPDLDLYIHRDYGLPALSHKKFNDSLFIASSYSGNTEEVIDFATKAHEDRRAVAVIALSGKLIEFAKKNNLPYIELPDTGIQPRSALGFSLIALAKFIGDSVLLGELHKLSFVLNPLKHESQGEAFARILVDKTPIIYASRVNVALAYNWKIKFNETAKIPAFYNIFSELNHNEMTGFDVISTTKKLSEQFHFFFITDKNDHPKIQKRTEVTKALYEERGLKVTLVPLEGESFWEKIFNILLIADWTALVISRNYGTESEEVPMIEEFKKRIA